MTIEMPPKKIKSDDRYGTPPQAVNLVTPYLKRDWLIWECASGSGSIVKLHADVSMAAFRKKVTIQLSMWHCLRSINSWGSGVLDFDYAIDYLVNNFNYSLKTAYRHLSKGNGLFWTLSYHNTQRRVEIKALKSVCEYLGTYLTGDKHCREVKATDFNTLLKRRGQLYASIHKPQGIRSNPICRATIQGMTGLHKVQQRRYEKVHGKVLVLRNSNYEVEELNGKYTLSRHVVEGKSRTYSVIKRMGNIYHSRQQPGHKGQTGKVSKELKHNKSLMSEGALVRLTRSYFTSLRRLLAHIRRHKQQDSGHYLLRNKNRLVKGRLEWCMHLV